jgi:hypothetical protein
MLSSLEDLFFGVSILSELNPLLVISSDLCLEIWMVDLIERTAAIGIFPWKRLLDVPLGSSRNTESKSITPKVVVSSLLQVPCSPVRNRVRDLRPLSFYEFHAGGDEWTPADK